MTRARRDALGRAREHLTRDEPDLAASTVRSLVALDREDVEAWQLLARALEEMGEHDEAIAARETLLDLAPDDVDSAVALALLLTAVDRASDALELLDALAATGATAGVARAEALLALGRLEEAAQTANQTHKSETVELGRSLGGSAHGRAMIERARQIESAALAELHGEESVVERAALDGDLLGRSGVNYRLLAHNVMASSTYVPELLQLQAPGEDLARARRLLATDRKSALGHSVLGIAELRLGHVGPARRAFDRACTIDRRCFPGLLGMGAVLEEEQHDVRAAAQRLEPATRALGNAALHALFSDWPVLTELERHVAAISCAPFLFALPELVRAGARVRILPIDVRATDLPDLADARGLRVGSDGDHRIYDAITGLANARIAIVHVEDVVDVITPENGWILAHEVAHLVLFGAPADVVDRVGELRRRAIDAGYVAGSYQLQNEHEFFAVACQDYLCARHGLPTAVHADDAGIIDETRALFDELSRRA